MKGLKSRLLAAGAATAFLSFGGSEACAAENPATNPTETEALKAQVKDLAALVKSMSERDQEQIQALASQVRALQAELGQANAAASAASAASVASAASISALARPAQSENGRIVAQGEIQRPANPGQALPRVVQNASNRFALQSADGEYSIGFTGDIQFDSGDYVGFKPSSRLVGPQALSNGVNARRARIGVAGTAFGSWGYAFVYDGGNSQDTAPKGIETAQVVYGGLPGAAFEIGYSNTYFTLDQATSSNDTLFIERASPSNIATNFNAGDARANAGVRFFGDRYWLGAYVTGPASGDTHTLSAERFGAFQRVAVQALKGRDYTLHLGLGVDELFQAPNSGAGTPDVLTLSDQPELRVDPTTFLNTGALGTAVNPVTGAHVFDVETAATWRNLFWQGEYYHYQVDRRGLAKAQFDGAYGELAWSLTGENRAYNPQSAAYYRIAPAHPFSRVHGGLGAWELAARISYVDLDSHFEPGTLLTADPAAVNGGQQIGYSLGLNWYPNDFIRLLLDYNHVAFDKANAAAVKGVALGAPVGAKLDALGLRVQVSY